MPPDRAKFEVRDVSAPTNHIDDEHTRKYMGPERRRENRREGADRREDVRFEIGKNDRRQNMGRREDDCTAAFW